MSINHNREQLHRLMDTGIRAITLAPVLYGCASGALAHIVQNGTIPAITRDKLGIFPSHAKLITPVEPNLYFFLANPAPLAKVASDVEAVVVRRFATGGSINRRIVLDTAASYAQVQAASEVMVQALGLHVSKKVRMPLIHALANETGQDFRGMFNDYVTSPDLTTDEVRLFDAIMQSTPLSNIEAGIQCASRVRGSILLFGGKFLADGRSTFLPYYEDEKEVVVRSAESLSIDDLVGIIPQSPLDAQIAAAI